MLTAIFQKHTFSKCSIAVYFLWWALLIKFLSSKGATHPHSCGAANGAFVMLTFFVALVYSIVLLIKAAFAEGQNRYYYLKCVGIVIAPFLAITVIIILYNVL